MTQVERSGELLDRRVEDDGATVELYRRGEAYDVVLDGRRVVASDARRSEQSLVELALGPLRGRDDISVLLGGLGMGFTLRAVLDSPGVKRVDVVEASPAIVEWEARYFAGLNGDALKDPRVKLHRVELASFLKQLRLGGGPEVSPDVPSDGWFALILDLDEGPTRLSRPGNQALYTDEGVTRLEEALRPGGVLALWSPQRETELVRTLHPRLQNVAEIAVPVELDGQASLDYVYRGRRPAPAPTKPAN
jgi:spermidine synthase